MVEFRRINLVEERWGLEERFDAIFCRNVIIYFDRDTQRALFERMLQRLSPSGLLFVGHSESLQWATNRLELVQHTVYRLGSKPARGWSRA
jgi:chemotaxis protein methyltransferase CheR